MTTPPATTERNPLLLGADVASALMALLAFVFGFLSFYGADSEFGGSASIKGFSLFPAVLALMLIGGLAAAQLGRPGGYRLQIAVAAGMLTLFEIGLTTTGGSDAIFTGASRKIGFWLLLVVVVLELLIAVAAVLVDKGVIKAPVRSADQSGQNYGGYGQPGGYGPPQQGYGQPAQGQYGQPSQGYAPPAAPPASPGYGQPAGTPSYGQPGSGGGYGQPAQQPPAQPGQQPPAQPGGGYGTSGSTYGQPAGQPPGQGTPPQQPGQGGSAPASQPWQSPNS